MMMNTYFEGMREIGEAWEAARKERKARKEQIIKIFGWKSEEMEAWKEEENNNPFPFTEGATKAYRAWAMSNRRGDDEIVMDDHLSESEVQDFVDTLRAAGIQSFVYTNKSTACMDNLHDLVEAGCTMLGLARIEKTGKLLTHTDRGVRFGIA